MENLFHKKAKSISSGKSQERLEYAPVLNLQFGKQTEMEKETDFVQLLHVDLLSPAVRGQRYSLTYKIIYTSFCSNPWTITTSFLFHLKIMVA